MLKAAGCIAVLISCIALGCGMSAQLAGRAACLRELQRMMTMLSGEIQYAGTPLQEAFLELSHHFDGAFARFLKDTAEAMQQRDGRTLADIFREEAEHLAEETRLLPEDVKKFAAMGGRLGYLDRKMQLCTIQLYQEELAKASHLAEEDYRQKAKVYQSLGFLGGCFMVLVLL